MITVSHEYSITATKVVREIFDSLMIGDYRTALGRLDQSKKKCFRNEFRKTLLSMGCDEIGDWRKPRNQPTQKSNIPTMDSNLYIEFQVQKHGINRRSF